MPVANDKILDSRQIAKFFGVSQKTVWEWCKHGKLPAFKIGKEWKLRQSDMQKFINQKVRTSKDGSRLF